MEATTSEYIEVRESGIHNLGVYAKKDIPKGARVIEYVGERITKAEADRRSEAHMSLADNDDSNGRVYIFELNKSHDIDGNVPWNTARYINHSCSPNCEAELIRGHIWIIAKKRIKHGEEISYNYGYGFDDYDKHPCNCGSKNCIGYILDKRHWPKLRKIMDR
ncbi:SET domain-containing protein-lysine N-methyltransferase [Candidatus Woesearchaeota archaeon]|nr:SET domain-containing protein-lysine N-methyltransferase [Candidatus Woesearchaeota archaeon]